MGMVFGSRGKYGGDEYNEDWGGCSWSTSCKSDPRFNLSGSASGVWSAMDVIDKAIRAKAKELGISEDKIPADIEYGGVK